MGWQGLSKGLIIGIIVGLIFGFAGGYYYKNLNASAPVTTTAVTKNSVSSGVVASSLALKLAPEIGGANGAIASATPSLTDGLARLLVPKAQAQSSCSSPSTGAVDKAINSALSGLFGSFDDGCRQAVISGKLDFEIYGDIQKMDYYVSIAFNVHITITALKPDCNSTEVVFDGDLNTTVVVHITKEGSTIVGGVPEGLPLICKGSLKINKTVGSIDKNRCPYCKKPVPTPTPIGVE